MNVKIINKLMYNDFSKVKKIIEHPDNKLKHKRYINKMIKFFIAKWHSKNLKYYNLQLKILKYTFKNKNKCSG